MKKLYTYLLIGFIFTVFSACDNYLDIKPTGSVIPTTLTEYRALIARAYKDMRGDRGMACLGSDEMQVKDNEWDQNALGDIERWNYINNIPATIEFSWAQYYSVSFIANQIIQDRNNIKDGATADINQIVGEAYLLRAYVHFILVNLHGQPYTKSGALQSKSIPLRLDTDIEKTLSRNTVEEVYNSILTDIESARQLINVTKWETKFSYRFNIASVEALQARVSLYMGDWQQAESASEKVLALQSDLEDLNAVTPQLPNLYTSVESIAALEFVMSNDVTRATLAPASFLALYDANDQRPALYFSAPDSDGNSQCNKGGYNKYNCTFRVGEFYLTSAEAAANQGKLAEARTRLNQLMEKRYTPAGYSQKQTAINAMNQQQLVVEILNERARELAHEGHRWFDLRRTTRPQLTKVLKGETYILKQDDPRYTIPIPKSAIQANPGLLN